MEAILLIYSYKVNVGNVGLSPLIGGSVVSKELEVLSKNATTLSHSWTG